MSGSVRATSLSNSGQAMMTPRAGSAGDGQHRASSIPVFSLRGPADTSGANLSAILMQDMQARSGGFATSSVSQMRSADLDDDPHRADLLVAEAQFFATSADKERINSARKKYPRKEPASVFAGGKGATALLGEDEDLVQRRIMGFGLGFEKIFATTSINLPVSAYTIFCELHPAHKSEVFNRCFNGLHTVFDLKKWIFETLLVPMNAYELSYAEPGKAELTDQLRLLTTHDSLDTRTLATTRAVHNTFRGMPGVHSISDPGVSRLYVRLKCRTCGDLLNSLQTCRKYKTFGQIQPPVEKNWVFTDEGGESPKAVRRNSTTIEAAGNVTKIRSMNQKAKRNMMPPPSSARSSAGIPGEDPSIEDCWHAPDPTKNCLFHTRGFEMFEGARTHSGGAAELARIYISRGKEPSKKLKMGENVLSARGPPMKISY